MDRGWLNNTGTATGTSTQNATVTAKASWFIPALQSPAIAIVKSANVTSFKAPGTKVTYSYKVTNTGNVTLSPVVVFDPMDRLSAMSCPSHKPRPSGDRDVHSQLRHQPGRRGPRLDQEHRGGHRLLPQLALDHRQLHLDHQRHPVPGPLHLPERQSHQHIKAGTKITISDKVTNTGNVTLSPVTVTDSLTGLSKITLPGHLAGRRGE